MSGPSPAPPGRPITFATGLTQNGTTTKIPTAPGSNDSEAVAINNRGMIAVNTTNVVASPASPGGFNPVQGHAFLLNGSNWTDVGTLGGTVAHILSMNNNGDVAGWSRLDASQTTHAMMVQFGKSMIDLGTLHGDSTSVAYGVNDKGQVVGLSYGIDSTADYHGFIYQNGIMEDLNSLLPPNSGWTIRWGLAINNLGQILALGTTTGDGGDGSILLLSPDGVSAPNPVYPDLPSPTPEPTALSTFGLLSIGLAWKFRKRPGRTTGPLA
jgi:probable HAF family extracellular repeat protein